MINNICFNPNKVRDPLLQKTDFIHSIPVKRVIDVAIPFLNLNPIGAKVTSMGMGFYNSFHIVQDLRVEHNRTEFAKKTGHLLVTITATGFSILFPFGQFVISNSFGALVALYQLQTHLWHHQWKEAGKDSFKLTMQAVFIASVLVATTELIFLSIAMQALSDGYTSITEFAQGPERYFEGVAYLLLTGIRGYSALPHARKLLIENQPFEMSAKVATLKLASYLTQPICKVREYFYTFYILDEICDNTTQKVTTAASLALGILAFSLLTPLTAPFGAILRGMVSSLETKPYIYLEQAGRGKVLPEDQKITLVSHNECYIPGGYCITNGQVTPLTERMDANLQKIKGLNPDVVCLYEVQDICDAAYISSQLPEYPFLIPVAGVRVSGPSSMMYVASKYEIAKDSIEFVPFVKGLEVTGRAQYSEKGVLSFDIISHGSKDPIATIISTHLQHSEISEHPEAYERESRAIQMTKIARQIQTKIEHNGTVIFTGDLNLDERELNSVLDQNQISWLRRDPQVQGKPTWGGDKWCADLMKNPASGPLTLDYTLIAGKASDISTTIVGTGYSGLEFRREATSDHDLLFSTITIN